MNMLKMCLSRDNLKLGSQSQIEIHATKSYLKCSNKESAILAVLPNVGSGTDCLNTSLGMLWNSAGPSNLQVPLGLPGESLSIPKTQLSLH
jgi:hypothetical protein